MTTMKTASKKALTLAAAPFAIRAERGSDVTAREDFRGHSVLSEVCVATVSGRGVDGYRDALECLKEAL